MRVSLEFLILISDFFSVYEPQVNEEVDKEEEEEILKDAELLCNRVTETEKSVGFKPFETIPLPKTLEDYTWLSLTKCITYCHQYITDHNMVSALTLLKDKS